MHSNESSNIRSGNLWMDPIINNYLVGVHFLITMSLFSMIVSKINWFQAMRGRLRVNIKVTLPKINSKYLPYSSMCYNWNTPFLQP